MRGCRGGWGTILHSSVLRSGPLVLAELVLVVGRRGLGRHLSLGRMLPRDGRREGMLRLGLICDFSNRVLQFIPAILNKGGG
jgi:hypothetical protein